MLRLVCAAVALLFLSVAAQAASFDCAKAGSSFERAICDNADLSAQDDVLAKAYATALGGLSDEAAGEIRGAQREWLNYAQRACSDDAEVIRSTYTTDQAACLTGVFQGRIRDLEESRMREGRRFYDVNRYAVLPDPEAMADSFQKVATKEFASPRIDADDEVAEAFNAMLEAFGAGREGSDGPDGYDPASDGTSDEDISIVIDAITLNRIGMAVNSYWYGHGAAHGNYTISYLHFLINERRALEAADVFSEAGWEDALADIAYADLETQFGEQGALFISAPSDLRESVSDPARWNFSSDGLVLRFQPYEVTAYAAGAPTVTIPWDSLSAYLAEGGERKAYY